MNLELLSLWRTYVRYVLGGGFAPFTNGLDRVSTRAPHGQDPAVLSRDKSLV